MINEAAECMGGAGYVEDSILPRLYREAPVNSTWEGSGNVQCLDVLRALSKEPGVLDALFAELGDGHGDARLAQHIGQLPGAVLNVIGVFKGLLQPHNVLRQTRIAMAVTQLGKQRVQHARFFGQGT